MVDAGADGVQDVVEVIHLHALCLMCRALTMDPNVGP